MGDGRLRDLERRFRETGAVEDEAAWLAARLRAGELTFDALALDAYLGHAPAQLALGEAPAPVAFAGDDAVVLWLRGFAAWGRELLARALLAWLRGRAGPREAWSPELAELWDLFAGWCDTLDPAAGARIEQQRRPAIYSCHVEEHAHERHRLGAVVPSMCAIVRAFHEAPVASRREALLDVLQRAHITVQGLPDVTALRDGLAARWAAGARFRLALPAGGDLRDRIEHAATPPARRHLVAALRALEGREASLLPADGDRPQRMYVESAGYESFNAFRGAMVWHLAVGDFRAAAPVEDGSPSG